MEYVNFCLPHQAIFFYAQWAQEPSHYKIAYYHLSFVLLTLMVINIPSESEASNATVIYGFLINEEVETQSAEGPQPQQPPEIDAMERTRNP